MAARALQTPYNGGVALVYLGVLLGFGALMITRRLTATLALPLTAVCIALIALVQSLAAGAPLAEAGAALIGGVAEAGVVRLHGAIFAVLLGAVLAAQLRLSGAAERIVRYAAEYGGEDRFWLGLSLLLTAALLFTVLGGLGAVILVASIALPLLLTMGYDAKVAAALLLLALSLGGTLNPANWALYTSVLELELSQIVPFAAAMFAIMLAVSLAYLLYQDRGAGLARRLLPILLLAAAGTGLAFAFRVYPAAWTALKRGCAYALLTLLAVLTLLLIARALAAARGSQWLAGPDNWLAALSVLVPLALLLWSALSASLAAPVPAGAEAAPPFGVPIVTALLCGIAFAAVASYSADGQALNRLMRALHEGVAHSAPAVVLLIGIGLLLQATTLPAVQDALRPWMAALPVQTPLSFIATFFILSPLALYRGPLNLFGMGAPIVGIIHGSGILAGSQIMVAFFSVGMLQGVCDPTNTHNAWVASFCKVPVAELTRHTFPWVLTIVLLGLIAGTLMLGGVR